MWYSHPASMCRVRLLAKSSAQLRKCNWSGLSLGRDVGAPLNLRTCKERDAAAPMTVGVIPTFSISLFSKQLSPHTHLQTLAPRLPPLTRACYRPFVGRERFLPCFTLRHRAGQRRPAE